MTLALAWSAQVKRRKPSPPRDYATDAKSGEKPTPEREAHGRFTSDTIYAHATDGDGTVLTKRTVETRRRRDADADLRNLGRRFPLLLRHHIEAAVLFEDDWQESGLEPRIIANLQGVRGPTGDDNSESAQKLAAKRFDAGTRVKAALNILRLAGGTAVDAVEAIVLQRATTRASPSSYVRGRDRAIQVATALEIGLSLLAAHYTVNGRIAAARTADRAA